jgi:hypothetical protein
MSCSLAPKIGQSPQPLYRTSNRVESYIFDYFQISTLHSQVRVRSHSIGRKIKTADLPLRISAITRAKHGKRIEMLQKVPIHQKTHFSKRKKFSYTTSKARGKNFLLLAGGGSYESPLRRSGDSMLLFKKPTSPIIHTPKPLHWQVLVGEQFAYFNK